jgi:Replication-relaxation
MDSEDRAVLGAAAHLTERDRYLVRLVGEHRVLTTGQLCALGFGSIITARHRLSVLAGIGALRRFRPHPETGSAPWHYLLGPVGAALLGAEDRDEKKWAPQVRADRQLALERSQRLSHMTGRNWFFAALAAHSRTGGGQLREWLNETQAASRYHGLIFVRPDDWDRLPNPDGLGTWAEAGRQVTFWLEYDTGTENMSRLAAKLDGYAILAAALASADTACPPLLFCLPGPRREQSARRALAGHPDAGKLRIATAAIDPRATCPAGPVWLPLGQASGQVRLIDLETVLPDPWQAVRDRARQRRAAVERERARLLEADWDEYHAAELAEQAAPSSWPPP